MCLFVCAYVIEIRARQEMEDERLIQIYERAQEKDEKEKKQEMGTPRARARATDEGRSEEAREGARE